MNRCRSCQRQGCTREYIDGGGPTLHECGEHLKAPKIWNVPPPKFHGDLGVWEEGGICIQQEK